MNKKPVLHVAILGNPNVGKSVLFNSITGASQIIGNWCGKTTEVCTMAVQYEEKEIHFTDFPGIYGYGGHSPEEKLVNDFLFENPPDVVMVVLDATKLELGLYLLLENLERFRRVMVILNKMDAAAEQDIVIYHDRLEAELQVPVLPESATGHLNTKELFDTIFEVAHKDLQGRTHAVRYGSKIENALAAVREQFYDIPGGNGRWQAIKSVETKDEVLQTEIISSRYNVASDIAARVEEIRPAGETPSDRIDRWMLHRAWGVPIMVAVFSVMFYLTFAVSRPVSEWMTDGFDIIGEQLGEWLVAVNVPQVWNSLIVDGILKGIGATLGFLPQMALFFLFYTLIQDSGYLVRVVFLVDRIMSALGMNGKTFLPLVLGCSCNVNGILASRILSSRYDRTVAILVSSYAPCPARLGVMVFLVSAFFSSIGATLAMLSLLGISLGLMVVVAYAVRLFIPREGTGSFMMELPPYQMPTLKSLSISTGRMTVGFLQRIRNVVIAASIVIWFLSNFPQGPFESSYIAQTGKVLEPVGRLMGLDWPLIVALLLGVAAKESALSGLGIIYHAANEQGNLAQALTNNISALSAFTFLLIYMIYLPCLTTLITMYQETKDWRIVFYGAMGSFVSAAVLGILVYQAGRLFG